MKIYVLMRHIDYEGSDVLAVYRNRKVGQAWLKWAQDNSDRASDSIGTPGGFYEAFWEPALHCYPADSYTLEEHETTQAPPPTPEWIPAHRKPL